MEHVSRGLVLGFYHQQNAGDDRLLEAIRYWLHDHHLYFLPHYEAVPVEILERVDYILFGGGSIADGYHGAWVDLIPMARKMKIPIYATGITVCSLEEELLSTLRRIPETGGRVWVRDEASFHHIGTSKGMIVAPDLTWMLDDAPNLPRKDRVALNLRPWSRPSPDTEAWRMSVESSALPYSFDPWALCFGQDSDVEILHAVCRGRPLPERAFVPLFPATCKAVCTMRFHGAIFAIQSGTPVAAIRNSVKLSNLIAQLDVEIPEIDAEDGVGIDEAVQRAISCQSELRLREVSQTMRIAAKRAAKEFKSELDAAMRPSPSDRSLRQRISSRVRRML